MNKINRETRQKPFPGSVNLTTNAPESHGHDVEEPSTESTNKHRKHDKRASHRYKKVRGEKEVQKADMTLQEVLDLADVIEKNPDGGNLNVKGV